MDNILDALPDDRTITWGDATFEIRKLLPTEAKPLFIHQRCDRAGRDAAAPAEHYEAISKAMGVA